LVIYPRKTRKSLIFFAGDRRLTGFEPIEVQARDIGSHYFLREGFGY
jgi:hypothetical protein